jgi:hypothetical protein
VLDEDLAALLKCLDELWDKGGTTPKKISERDGYFGPGYLVLMQ